MILIEIKNKLLNVLSVLNQKHARLLITGRISILARLLLFACLGDESTTKTTSSRLTTDPSAYSRL